MIPYQSRALKRYVTLRSDISVFTAFIHDFFLLIILFLLSSTILTLQLLL